jgi:hypothetical protein
MEGFFMFKKIVLIITLALTAGSLYAMDCSTSADAERHAKLIAAIRAEDTEQIKTLIAQGVDIHANDNEAQVEAFKLKAPQKWDIMDLLQDPANSIKCLICFTAINPKLSTDNLKSVVVGNKLFKECREDHCFHAECIGRWVRTQEEHGRTLSCPLCTSHINPKSTELKRLHDLVPAPTYTHQRRPTPNDSLVNAAQTGSIANMQQAFDDGASINYFSGSPLRAALKAHHFNAADWLITQHADINIWSGWPLRKTLENKNVEAVQWLIDHGVDISARHLEIAIDSHDQTIIDLLYAHSHWQARLDACTSRHSNAFVASTVVIALSVIVVSSAILSLKL